MRTAVIGIGSNSLRLLLADTMDGHQTAVLRERIGLRVFASLNSQLEIADDMIHNACEAVALLKCNAEKNGAEAIYLFATSAVRDAANKAAFAKALLQKTGLSLDIVSGELEAKLSFLGAAGEGSAGMIDIGGGSTEIVIGDGGNTHFATSLQAGAVRLFGEYSIHSAADLSPIIQAVKALLTPHLQAIAQCKTPARWVGVGGTMTAAASCIQDIPWNSDHGIHGYTAKKDEVRRVLEKLSSMTLDQRCGLRSIPSDRADIIVHGLTILYACMEALLIESIQISKQTNLDGYLQWITVAG